MSFKLKLLSTTALLSLLISGCGAATSTNSSNASNMAGLNMSSDSNMTGMNMSNTTQGQSSSDASPLKQAFQDQLNGFTTIQDDIKNGNYSDATAVANKLHDEFHAVILPPLKAKKGDAYAEAIHSKYDALQDAIAAKDTAKINSLVKINRDNLHTVASILGISLT